MGGYHLERQQEGIQKTVSGHCKVEVQLRVVRDWDRIIPAKTIAGYLSSPSLFQIIRGLHNLKEKMEFSINDFRKVRNHLMLSLQLINGKRAGIFSMMTIQEHRNTEEANQMYAVAVAGGKPPTSCPLSSGPISIANPNLIMTFTC